MKNAYISLPDGSRGGKIYNKVPNLGTLVAIEGNWETVQAVIQSGKNGAGTKFAVVRLKEQAQ